MAILVGEPFLSKLRLRTLLRLESLYNKVLGFYNGNALRRVRKSIDISIHYRASSWVIVRVKNFCNNYLDFLAGFRYFTSHHLKDENYMIFCVFFESGQFYWATKYRSFAKITPTD